MKRKKQKLTDLSPIWLSFRRRNDDQASNATGRGPGGRDIAAFFEVHIEQGPILEAEERTIGIVSGAQAQHWYDITLTGRESHAGTTPMERRHDALVGVKWKWKRGLRLTQACTLACLCVA